MKSHLEQQGVSYAVPNPFWLLNIVFQLFLFVLILFDIST